MFDRFTRDEVSSWVWWPATLVLLVLLVLTFPGEGSAVEERRDAAAERAWSLATGTIAPALEGTRITPISPERAGDLATILQESGLGAPWTDVVRIFTADGTLVWSSDPADPIGSAGALNDAAITAALADLTRATVLVTDRDLDGEPIAATFSAYAPFTLGSALAAAQFEVADATLLDDVRDTWLAYRIVLGVAGLLTLAFAIGSMREPVAKIGAGVPFFRSSLPRGMDVIEVDRKVELERAGAHARERVAHMDARLQESEALRLKAEGDLQRALAQRSTAPRPARSVIAPPAETATPEPEPARSEAPTRRRRSPERAEPRRRASRAPEPAAEPERRASREPEPAAEPERPAARSRRAERGHPSERTEAERTPVGDERPEEPTVAREPERERPRPRPRRTPAPAEPPAARADGLSLVPPIDEEPTIREDVSTASREEIPSASRDDLIVVPEAEPATSTPAASTPVGPSTEELVDLATHDPEAREVLERLVEPVGATVVPSDDPSVLRAKLARTAALKKPGSRREARPHGDGSSA